MKKKRISIALFLISIGFLTSCASTHSSISVDVPEDSANEPSTPDSSISSPDVSSDMAEEVSSSLDSSGQETEGEESSWQTFGRLPYEKLRYLSEMKDEKKNYSPSLRDVSANFNAYENKLKILNASYPSRLATVTVTTEEEDGDKSYVGYLLDYVDGRIIESYPSAVPVSSLPVTTVSGLPLVIVSKPDNNTYSLVDLAGNYLLSYLRKKPTPIHVVTRKKKDHFVYDFILEDESIGRKAFESYLDERTGCYFFKEIPFSSYPVDQELRPLTDLHINSKGYYVGSIENGFYLYGPEKNYLNCIIPASFPINEANVASTNYIYTDSAIYYVYTEEDGKTGEISTYAYAVDLTTGDVSVAFGLDYVILKQTDYKKAYGDSYVYDGALLAILRIRHGQEFSQYLYLLSVDETISPVELYDYDPIYTEGNFYQIGEDIVGIVNNDAFVMNKDNTTKLLPGVSSLLYQDGDTVIYKDELDHTHLATKEEFLSGNGQKTEIYDAIGKTMVNGVHLSYNLSGEKGILQDKTTFDAGFASFALEGLILDTTEATEEEEGTISLYAYGKKDSGFTIDGSLLSFGKLADCGMYDSLYQLTYSYKNHTYSSYFVLDREVLQ